MEEEKQEYITFQVEPDLKLRFKEKCNECDITISQQIRRMIKQFLGESD